MLSPSIALSLALALATPPPADGLDSPAGRSDSGSGAESGAGSQRVPAGEAPGAIVFGPAARGRAVVIDADGVVVAHLSLVAGHTTTVGLPPGRYRVDADGQQVAEVEVGPGETLQLARPPLLSAPVPTATELTPRRARTLSAATPGPRAAEPSAVAKQRHWKRIGAPLLSALLPGTGQIVTQRPGRGMAMFAGVAGMTLGAAGLWSAADPAQGATRGAGGESGVTEVVRLGGFAALSGAAALLYVAQILDAYGGAVGKLGDGIRPNQGHAVALEIQRSATVGFTPSQPEYALLSDYSVAVMGQLIPRLTLGASDLSVKLEPERVGVVVQGGLRTMYRVYQRRRLWLSVGGGVVVQGTSARQQRAAIDPVEVASAPDEGRLSAFMYTALDARFFVLDRWALLVVPRLSLPFAERRFGRGRAIPRWSTTFELALGGAVHF